MEKELFRKLVIEELENGTEPEEIFKKYQEHIPLKSKIRFIEYLNRKREKLKPIQLKQEPPRQTYLQKRQRVPKEKYQSVRTTLPKNVYNFLKQNTNNVSALIRLIILNNYEKDISEIKKEFKIVDKKINYGNPKT